MHCQHCGRYHNEDTCPYCGPESDEAITGSRMAEHEEQARDYTEAYAIKYNITDVDLLAAIYRGHLAYLVNTQPMDEAKAEYHAANIKGTVERGDWVSQEIADSEFTEAEIGAQMDLIDRVDEMDEGGVFDLDARLVVLAEAEVDRPFGG